MAQYIDKSALVAEIERRMQELRPTNTHKMQVGEKMDRDVLMWLNALTWVKKVIDTIEVKEVKEEPESIWHDANKQPTMYRKYLVRYSDGRVSGSWERHDNGFIPWEDVIKEHGFTHWCYVEDLIKL